MSGLIERLEAAEAGSRELGIEVIEATNPHTSGIYSHWHTAAMAFDWDIRVTTSLDAALALAERVLPGLYMWNVEFDDEPTATPASARVYTKEGDASGFAPTPALALCIAILKAKEASDA